ncbi:MAG: DUF3078 domain-containing protein [Tannerellaceae bacterium]|nr:DUF3078 domain-containing protein [Tannerellaceae bacterium]
MSMGKHLLYILCVFFFSLSLNAQEIEIQIEPAADTAYPYEAVHDSISNPDDDKDPDKLFDIRYQLKKQNKQYSKPVPMPEELRRKMANRNTQLSQEALYWSRRRIDPSQYFASVVNFRDTIIKDPFLLPLVFKKEYLEKEYYLGHESDLIQPKHPYAHPYVEVDTTLFRKERLSMDMKRKVYRHLAIKDPTFFKYTEEDLPDDIIQVKTIKKEPIRELPVIVRPEKNIVEIAPPAKFIPDRMYWTSQFESAIQFSQNYISPNWHQGGNSNLNLYTKNHLRYNYSRDKIQFNNEIEDKISIYNATKDTIHRYKVGEDIFRIYSNFGYQAFNKWYYTIDGEFRTPLLKSYEENSEKQIAGFLAPLNLNIGIGMKYELNKEFIQKGKNLQLAVNLAPLSYSYKYSRNRDIDLGRHGFEKKKDAEGNDMDEYNFVRSELGSTLRMDMTMSFNPNIMWQSRIYYFTTYEKVNAEFENTLILAISRHFSTRIYLNLRLDDSAEKTEGFDSYVQVNELLSFGFNYRW